MRRFGSQILIAAALLLGAVAAQAQEAYIGVAGGVSRSQIDFVCGPGITCDKTSPAFKLYAGGLRTHFGMEVALVNFGKPGSNDGVIEDEFTTQGLSLAAIAALPLGPVVPFAKFGASTLNTEYKAVSSGVVLAKFNDTHSAAMFGGGVQLKLGDSLMVRGEWERYRARILDNNFNIDFVSASVAYRF